MQGLKTSRKVENTEFEVSLLRGPASHIYVGEGENADEQVCLGGGPSDMDAISNSIRSLEKMIETLREMWAEVASARR